MSEFSEQERGMSAATETLDSLLPLLRPEGRELHLNAAIVEVAEPAQLAELAANPRIRRFLLARLSDTVALVDPGHAGEIEAALLAEGHTPKVLRGDGE
jgi:hypothetical protein